MKDKFIIRTNQGNIHQISLGDHITIVGRDNSYQTYATYQNLMNMMLDGHICSFSELPTCPVTREDRKELGTNRQELINKRVKEKINQYGTDPRNFVIKYLELQQDSPEDKEVNNIIVEETLKSLNIIYSVLPKQLVLRAVAIVLDKKYTDHIKDSGTIYGIDLSREGKIISINAESIKDWSTFAAFRSISDAVLAKIVLRELDKWLEFIERYDK